MSVSNMIFLTPYFGNSNGLCNELSFVINAILYCSINKIQYIILDNFLVDNSDLRTQPFSEIIDLDSLNEYLTKFNVVLKDKKFLSTPLDCEKLKKMNINEHTCVHEDWINPTIFYEIYNNIVFKPHFYNLSNNLIAEIKQKLGDDIKINVIHLRIEDDAINHWSTIANMSPALYKNILVKKYLKLINRYINKNVFTIVMSYSKNNAIIKYLNDYGYNFFTKKTDHSIGRECNAIQDLLLAKKMNNFFIGAKNSTFSHFIANSTNYKKRILIDIGNLNSPTDVLDK